MAEEELQGIEERLEQAISHRLQHFRDQASSLTMESVRRLLEKDLDLRSHALDKHKGLVRQYVEKMMDDAGGSEKYMAELDEDKDAHQSKEEKPRLPKKLEVKNDLKKPVTGDQGTTEDSPIMCVLTPKSESGLQGSSLNESRIEKALWDRADYLRANSEKITMAGVRRILEEDLGLEKCTLDPFKKFVSQQTDRVLCSHEESAKDSKPDDLKGRESEKKGRKRRSDDHNNEMDVKAKKRKETMPKSTTKNSEQLKKKKVPEESDLGVSNKKSKKHLEEESDNSDKVGSSSDDGQPESHAGKPVQIKEKSVAAYGKRVENLKSIIKACGLSVPPSIYKKAKQATDREREALLLEELKGILSKEGLSDNPSDKEIRDCRKRKEKARELEGIDTSNIITSSRRRSGFSFSVPVQLDAQPKKGKADSKKSKCQDTTKDSNDAAEEKDVVKKEKKNEMQDEETKEEDDVKVEEEEKEGEEGDEEEDDEEGEEEEEDEEEEEEEEEDDAEESDDFNEDESD